MLVKITDFPDDLVDDLKAVTGQVTASKAVFHAATRYTGLLSEFNDLCLYIAQLEQEGARLRSIIEGARSAAALLLDQTAQESLL